MNQSRNAHVCHFYGIKEIDMTEEEVSEAKTLISAHHSLRWNIVRNSDRAFGLRMYAKDERETTTQPSLPAPIAYQVLFIALGLVEARLRELGVTPEQGWDLDCFECGGSGKRAME
jgi:hypothetical protein